MLNKLKRHYYEMELKDRIDDIRILKEGGLKAKILKILLKIQYFPRKPSDTIPLLESKKNYSKED